MFKNLISAAFATALIVSPAFAKQSRPTRPSAPSHRVVNRIAGADGGWDFAAIDPARGRLYVARSDAVMAVDLASNTVTPHLAGARRGHAVLVLDDGATLFETDGETGLGRFIDAASGAVLTELQSGKKPDAAFNDPATGLLAVMNAGDGNITLIDPRTRTLAGSIVVGGALEFAVADGHGGAFVNVEDKAEIARVDLRTRKRTGTIALPGCEGPTGLGLTGNRLIVACDNDKALVIEAESGRLQATIPIGHGPDAVLVDEQRGFAFIPCGGSGTLVALSIRDPRHIAVAETIVTQTGAKTGAIDPRDGRIYLPTATIAPPEPGAKRGKPVPGSFTILVVGMAN